MRTGLAPAAMLIVAATAVSPGLPRAGAKAHHRPAARMLVYAQEWSLWPSRSTLPAGRVIVQLWNRGQDPHDLRIRRLNPQGQMTGATEGVRVTQSGTLREATWRLSKGAFELYCSMPGHLAQGMHARIIVR